MGDGAPEPGDEDGVVNDDDAQADQESGAALAEAGELALPTIGADGDYQDAENGGDRGEHADAVVG